LQDEVDPGTRGATAQPKVAVGHRGGHWSSEVCQEEASSAEDTCQSVIGLT
jgi:hypothetical protein